jgi:16S rRNA (cytosine967-C5)-methyltransferase
VAQTSARGIALAALRTWRAKREFADAIISSALSKSALQSADRAFALDLFYGVLRNLMLLDFWIRCLRTAHVDVDLRDLLRLGFYQLFILKTPEHAAVNETVELASKRHRSIANAMLRNAARKRAELDGKARTQPLHIQWSHPAFLVERWTNTFGSGQTVDLCCWNNRPPPIYARINLLKNSSGDFARCYDAFVLDRRDNFAGSTSLLTNAANSGHCYIQDPSTAIACELLDPQPGETILDACAAPGGKTGYLAELMDNRGSIMACDRDSERLHLLDDNLMRLGVESVRSARQDWTKQGIAQEIVAEAPFDRILVDAPCSNTGVIRRRVDVRWRLTPKDFRRMQERQIEIVRATVPLLKPGGILVYSTCSLEQEENEDVVHQLLRTMSILEYEEQKSSLPFRDGFDGAFAARIRRRN